MHRATTALLPRLACLAVTGLMLAGCSGSVQEKFGMGKRAPDEFRVVRRAPLVLPPDFNLRPPGTTAGRNVPTTAEQAREIVTGEKPAAAKSPVEQALLAESPVRAEPGIRQVLLEENTALTQLDESRFLFILDWQRDLMTPDEPVIDAASEAERLAKEGKPVRVMTTRTATEPIDPSAPPSTY